MAPRRGRLSPHQYIPVRHRGHAGIYKTAPTDNQNGISSVVFDGSQKLQQHTARIFVGVSRSSAANVYKTEMAEQPGPLVDAATTYMPLRMKGMDPDGNLC